MLGVLTVQLKVVNGSSSSSDKLLRLGRTGTNELQPDAKVSLLNHGHRFCTLQGLVVEHANFAKKTNSLCMFLLGAPSWTALTPRGTVLFGRTCNNHSGMLLACPRFRDTVNSILTFAKTFEVD